MSKKLLQLAAITFVMCFWATSALVVQAGGYDLKTVQAKLKELGYYNAKVDGISGDGTVQAIKRFQKARGLKVDGIVGPSVWNSLVGSKSSNGKSTSSASGSYDLKTIQAKLKNLGYYNSAVDGVSGTNTVEAIKKFQRAYGLSADGVVGSATYQKLMNANASKTVSRSAARTTSRGNSDRGNGLVDWSEAQNIFSVGAVATIIDVRTGAKFQAKRTMGYNHSDTETLTTEDTAVMRRLFGGWTWDRRPVIVVVNGRKLAASMSGMPHAGLDSAPAYKTVSGRAGGFGTGENLDTIKGNGMDGHFDIHFLNSRTHGTNKIDPAQQAAVREAANYIANQ